MNKIVIQYQIQQVLTNKNSLTEMSRQLWKIEKSHNQTTLEQKINLENLKRIMNEEKTTLPSQRNIKRRIVKTETEKIKY